MVGTTYRHVREVEQLYSDLADYWYEAPLQRGGATVAVDPVTGCAGVAVCALRDCYSRTLGRAIAERRLSKALAECARTGHRAVVLPRVERPSRSCRTAVDLALDPPGRADSVLVIWDNRR